MIATGPCDAPVIGRLLRSADFKEVLATRTRFSSPHFAVHHVTRSPSSASPAGRLVKSELSTGHEPVGPQPVDDFHSGTALAPALAPVLRVWLGTVVPKRHARRSVTRSLLKRQMRNVVASQYGALPGGIWVLRLRAPFDRAQFPSAASDAVKRLVRSELEQLLAGAITRSPDRSGRPGR